MLNSKAYKPEDVSNNPQVVRHDPDARLTIKNYPGYKVHRMVDHKYGIILNDLATPGNVSDHVVVPDLLRTFKQSFKIQHKHLVMDGGYRDQKSLSYADRMGYDVYVPMFKSTNTNPGLFGIEDFKYDLDTRTLICPAGKVMRQVRYREERNSYEYKMKGSICNQCNLKERCTKNKEGRTCIVLENAALITELIQKRKTRKHKTLMTKRKIYSEGSFGEAKVLHGMDVADLRGLENMNIQCLITSILQNIKKFVKYANKPKASTSKNANIENSLAVFIYIPHKVVIAINLLTIIRTSK